MTVSDGDNNNTTSPAEDNAPAENEEQGTEVVEEVDTDTPAEDNETPDLSKEVEKWKSLSRKNEDSLKEFRKKYEEASAGFSEMESKNKEKDSELSELRQELRSYKVQSILSKYGIDDDYLEFIESDDLDEMDRKAQKLSEKSHTRGDGHKFKSSSDSDHKVPAKSLADVLRSERKQSD